MCMKTLLTQGAILCVWGERKWTFSTTTVTHMLHRQREREREMVIALVVVARVRAGDLYLYRFNFARMLTECIPLGFMDSSSPVIYRFDRLCQSGFSTLYMYYIYTESLHRRVADKKKSIQLAHAKLHPPTKKKKKYALVNYGTQRRHVAAGYYIMSVGFFSLFHS